MKAGSVLCCFYILTIIGSDAAKATEENRRLSDVDLLLELIELEQWGEAEAPCVKTTLAILHGVKNSTLWATWIWDSMQRPAGFLYGSRYQLGSFDQCLKPPWLDSHPLLRTQYCLADVRLTDAAPRRQRAPLDPYATTSSYFENTSSQGRYFNVLSWGVCLPSACSQGSVHKILRAMVRTQHLLPTTPDLHITIDSCQRAGDPIEYSFEFKAFFILLLGLTVVSILAMFYSRYTIKNSLGNKLVNSFDLKRNWNKFIEEPQDQIASANGIKFLNAAVVTKVHYILFVNSAAVINGLQVEKDFETPFGTMMTHIDVIIDTFFFISGLLLVNGLHGKRKNPIVGLIKRYIRNFGPLAVMMFYFAAVHKSIGSGPLWPKFNLHHEQSCRKNWWINLLMLTNYINCEEICHIMTWYIAADFQLAIVGSFIFYIYQNNRRFGKWLFCISLLTAMAVPAFLTYWYHMKPLFIYDPQKMIDICDNEVFLRIHIKSYCRASVYMLGMLLGHHMSHYNPAAYRNTLSKKWSMIGAGLALLLMFIVMNIGGILYHREYNVGEAAIFVYFDKAFWSIGIGALIFVSEYGHAPVVSDILRFKPFGTLSKLCYGIYLIHSAILLRIAHSTRAPMTHAYFEMVVTGIGLTFYVLPFALYMYLFVEAPAGNLANSLFESRKPITVEDPAVIPNDEAMDVKPKVS